MINQKVVFLEYCQVEAQGEIVRKFKKGKQYEMPAPSAQRWIRRGVAELVVDSAPKAAKPKGRPKAKAAARKPKAKPLTDYDLPGKVDRDGIDKREAGED